MDISHGQREALRALNEALECKASERTIRDSEREDFAIREGFGEDFRALNETLECKAPEFSLLRGRLGKILLRG
jgi:hypothetical protein